MKQETPANENVATIAEKIKDIRTAMMTTVALDGSLHSRPMATQQQEFDGDLWFFTGKDSLKIDELEKNNQVSVAYAAPDDNRYVSISGTASIVDDQAKIDELWSPFVKAWFPDGKDDPNITLVHVKPETAEYWDSSSSTLVQVVGFAKALLTGKQADGGDHDTVDL